MLGGLKTFFIPPIKLLVCVFGGGGLKTETGKVLLHFQNSKSSNRWWSVYGTDIKTFNFEHHFLDTTYLPGPKTASVT